MRIHQQQFPYATLLADRVGPLTFDGGGTLLFSRCECWIKLEGVKDLSVTRWHIIGLHNTTRLRRFLTAIPALWRFCK